jgi:hypothetical protein
MIKIQVRTKFDITATGTTGHFKSSRIPYVDQADQSITDIGSWNRSRNQQRNFETLLQVLSLRTQILEVTTPECQDGKWQFEFCVEAAGIFGEEDNFSVLYDDADGVPMLRELDNDADVDAVLITLGPKQNVWFTLIPINNILENTNG